MANPHLVKVLKGHPERQGVSNVLHISGKSIWLKFRTKHASKILGKKVCIAQENQFTVLDFLQKTYTQLGLSPGACAMGN